MRTTRIIATAVVVLTTLTATVAGAEEPDITDRQRELNDQGVAAIEEGDYQRAIEVYQSSLELGELNIIHANLGRAHQLAGDCEAADHHFQRALEAPAVEQPPPERIEETVDNYRDELAGECPGYLEVECEPTDMELYLDGEGPEQCRSDPRELMPGDYDVRGEYGDQSAETSVTVRGLETTTAQLQLDVDDPPQNDVQPPGEVAEPTDEGLSPWVWLAGSAAAVGGGIALDTVPAQANNYEVNAINFVPVVLYAAGAGMGFMGIRGLLK